MDTHKVAFLEKIEEYLIKSSVHIDVVKELMNFLARKVSIRKDITENEILNLLENQIKYMIGEYVKHLQIDQTKVPYVMLVCGINGSGKTTIIGKMTYLLNSLGWDIVVAACDTFRAAAKEQLQMWTSENVDNFVFKEHENETATKIALKALGIAKERHKDVLIIDTAGRLQNNQSLMAELLKMKQKLRELANGAPHDVILVIDANCGYNALSQVKTYNDLIGITGIIATKIDIAKRPGALLSVCRIFKIPIYGISDGEKKENIKDLNPDEFAKNLMKDFR